MRPRSHRDRVACRGHAGGATQRGQLAQFGHLVLQPARDGYQFGAALADGFHEKQARLRLHRLGVRTHKIAINSYPIQRPLWTTLRTSSRTSRDVREVKTASSFAGAVVLAFWLTARIESEPFPC